MAELVKSLAVDSLDTAFWIAKIGIPDALLHNEPMKNGRIQAMTTLTVTGRGQVTLRKDVLHHLGIRPGEKIALEKLPDGRVALRPLRPAGKIDAFLGLLAGKTRKVATLDEISEATST
jgi:antitoxin PrlF